MRAYSYDLIRPDRNRGDTKIVGSLSGGTGNGSQKIQILEEDGAPTIQISLAGSCGSSSLKTRLTSEGLREVGFLFLTGALHSFPAGWTFDAGRTPSVPNPEVGRIRRVSISEDELKRREQLLLSELNRVRFQLEHLE